MFKAKVLPYIIWITYRLLSFSWRLKIVETPELKKALQENAPINFAFWHGDELALICLLNPYRCCVMTSTSNDGELMDSTLKLMGVKSSRGSSTRGGVGALKGILRLCKDGFRPAVAVDGPKGPYHKVKPGIFEIAKVTGSLISVAGVSVSNAFVFKKAWNKTYLPLPFSKVVIVLDVGNAGILRDQDVHNAELAKNLENTLAAAAAKAAALL